MLLEYIYVFIYGSNWLRSILNNLGGKDFLNHFGFWYFKFLAANQILSFANLKENLKLTRKRWLVKKCKNTHTKLQLLEAIFSWKLTLLSCMEITWFPMYVYKKTCYLNTHMQTICIYIYIYIYIVCVCVCVCVYLGSRFSVVIY